MTSFLHASIAIGMLLTLGCSFQEPYRAVGVEARPDSSGGTGGSAPPPVGSSPPDDGNAMFTEGPGAAGANGAASAEGGSASFEEVSGPAAAGGSESSGGGEQFGDGASDAPAGGGGSAAIDTAQGAGVGADGNLMPDPSFEVGISGWFFFGTSTVALASGIARTGDHALASSGRTQAFEGPAFDIEPLVQGGAVYDVALWVLADAGTHPFKLSLKATCRGQTDAEATYTTLDQLTAAASAGWSELAGSFTAPTRCPLAELFIYVEDPPPGVSFFVDDVSLFKALR